MKRAMVAALPSQQMPTGSRWEYELFEGGDGKDFCRSVLERGTILSEIWQQVRDGQLASLGT